MAELVTLDEWLEDYLQAADKWGTPMVLSRDVYRRLVPGERYYAVIGQDAFGSVKNISILQKPVLGGDIIIYSYNSGTHGNPSILEIPLRFSDNIAVVGSGDDPIIVFYNLKKVPKAVEGVEASTVELIGRRKSSPKSKKSSPTKKSPKKSPKKSSKDSPCPQDKVRSPSGNCIQKGGRQHRKLVKEGQMKANTLK